jgi:Tfp pilus assembly protein PilN
MKAHPRAFAIGAIAIATLLVAFAARVLITQATARQVAENERLERALGPLKDQVVEVDPLRDLIQDFLARKQIVETIRPAAAPAAEALAELSQLPRSIVLKEVQLERMHLVATSTVRRDEDLQAVLAKLSTSRLFGNPRVRTRDPKTGATEIEMELRP